MLVGKRGLMKKLVEVINLIKHFPVQKGLFKRTVGLVKSVDDVMW